MTLVDFCNNLALHCDKEYENLEVKGLNTLKDASSKEISFLENSKYLQDLKTTKALAVLISKEYINEVPRGVIALITNTPYVKLAYASKLFAPQYFATYGIEAVIGQNCNIMPNAYLSKGVRIGDNVTIMSGAFIGDNVKIGDNTVIYPNVTIYRDCIIGSDCIIHANSVIGSDGFGFAPSQGEFIKIYQNGNVIIEDNVEIGANCAIDRAVFNSTIIKSGVKIDNLVHIAHNVEIGENSVLVAQVGISGSTKLGNNVIMGGQSGAVGHVSIAPWSTISAKAGVSKDIIDSHKTWAGFPHIEISKWLKIKAKMAKLLKK